MQKLADWTYLNLPRLMQCDDARGHFRALLYEEPMDPEIRGLLRGHLDTCDECSSLFAELIETALADHTIEAPDAPPFPWPDGIPAEFDAPESIVLPPLVSSDGVYVWPAIQRIHRTLGSLPKAARVTAQAAYQEVESLRERLLTMIQPMATTQQPAWQPMAATLHLGENNHPSLRLHLAGGEMLVVEATTPPQITAAGEFQLVVRTKDTRVVGQQLYCQLDVGDGDAVVFDAAPFMPVGDGYHIATVIATDMPVAAEAAYPIAIASLLLKLELKPENNA
jgi:hypothetical protein